MSFSHRRENDEKSRRDSRLGLSIFCWEAHTHGSQQLFALALLGKPTFAVREVRAAGKSAPAGANCRIALAARSACSAVDCTSLPSANTCREPTRCVFGSHKRSSGTLAVSFRSFLVRTRKEHVSPLQRRKYVLFSLRRKAPKDSPRRCLGLSLCYWEAHTHGSQQLFALALLGKPTFAVREVRAAGKSAPTGARRAPCERHPA